MPRLHAPALLLLLLLGSTGCDGRPPARAETCPTSSWEALHADPTLVPTREGERVRRELATADAVRRAVLATGDVRDVHVVLRLREPGGRDGRAHLLVQARGEPPADDPERARARAQIRALVDAAVREPWSDAQTQIDFVTQAEDEGELAGTGAGARAPAAPDDPWRTPRGWLLALCLLGLGASAGISLDRLRTAATPRRRP